MGPEASSDRFIINGVIQNMRTGLYLNVDVGATTSYKAISFGSSANFRGWQLEGDTISTGNGSVLGRREFDPIPCSNQSAVLGLGRGCGSMRR